MSIRPTTETIMLPGGGWRNVPIGGGFTPGIIDHYPEGPGETRPFEPWFNNTSFSDPEMVLRFPQTRMPGQRPNEIPLNPGSLNIPTVGATGPGILASTLLGAGGLLAGKFLGNLFNK